MIELSSLQYILLAIFALLVGSFLNLMIYRLPLMLYENLWMECQCLLPLNSKPKQTLNLFLPRSFCPACHTPIKAIHNIPLLSYLLLRGRCKSCHSLIGYRYPLVEALSLLFAMYASWHFGFHVSLIFVLIFGWTLIGLLFIDLEHQLLPDSLTLGLLWLGLIANTHAMFTPLSNAVLSAAGAYMSLWLFIKLFYLITGKVGMGHGDFKLFAAFGAWFGLSKLPLILLISCITGAISGLIYLKSQKKSTDTPIAFGPFLCIAGIIALFWGESLNAWYLKMIY